MDHQQNDVFRVKIMKVCRAGQTERKVRTGKIILQKMVIFIGDPVDAFFYFR
jgi:hypothetical protein